MTEGEEIYEYRNDYPDYYRLPERFLLYILWYPYLVPPAIKYTGNSDMEYRFLINSSRLQPGHML